MIWQYSSIHPHGSALLPIKDKASGEMNFIRGIDYMTMLPYEICRCRTSSTCCDLNDCTRRYRHWTMSKPKKHSLCPSIFLILYLAYFHSETLVFGFTFPSPIRQVQLPAVDSGSNTTQRPGRLRRWYAVDPDLAGINGAPNLWKDSTVPYCFKNANSETQLKKITEKAWKFWVTA